MPSKAEQDLRGALGYVLNVSRWGEGKSIRRICLKVSKDCKGCSCCKYPIHVPAEIKAAPCEHLFVGQNPGSEEVLMRRPFVGRSGALLRSVISVSDVGKKDVGFMNPVGCGTDENSKPKAAMQKECLKYALAYIAVCKPKRLYLLGELAYKMVLGTRYSSVFGLAYSKYLPKVIGLPELVFLPHPSYMLRVGVESVETAIWAKRLSGFLSEKPLARFDEKVFLRGMLEGCARKRKDESTVDFWANWGRYEKCVKEREGGVRKYVILDREDRVREFLNRLEKHTEPIVVDIETTGLSPSADKITVCGVALSETEGYVFPCDHRDNATLPEQVWFSLLKRVYRPPNDNRVSAHNTTFEASFGVSYGLEMGRWTLDTQYLAYMIDENVQSYSMEALATRFLDEKKVDVEDFATATLDILYDRCGFDVLMQYEVLNKQMEIFKRSSERDGVSHEQREKLWHLMSSYMATLGHLRFNGLDVNLKLMRSIHDLSGAMVDQYVAEMQRIAAKASPKMFGEKSPLNTRSVKQMATLLYDVLGFPVVDYTKGGQASTAASTLDKLIRETRGVTGLRRKFLRVLKLFRRQDQLQKTFIVGYLNKTVPISKTRGRIYASILPTASVTGRPQARQPNINNIPRKDSLPKWMIPDYMIKSCIIARPGCLFLGADVSQAELRWLASLSKDPVMISIFKNDGDIHDETSQAIFNEGDEQWARVCAKAVNFGIIYGETEFGLARNLEQTFYDRKIDRKPPTVDECKEFIDTWFRKYLTAGRWILSVRDFASRKGFVVSPIGRIRRPPQINSPDKTERFRALRQSVNAVVQGMSDDQNKMHMMAIQRDIVPKYPKMVIHLPLYDAIYMSVPEDRAEVASQDVKYLMEHRHHSALVVPLRVDVKLGKSWGDLE